MLNGGPDYDFVYEEYLKKNRPFLLVDDACVSEDGTPWPVLSNWTVADDPTKIDVDYISDKFGELYGVVGPTPTVWPS